jgi:hypothetical protein
MQYTPGRPFAKPRDLCQDAAAVRGIPDELESLIQRWARELPGEVLLWAEVGARAAHIDEAEARRSWELSGVHVSPSAEILGLDPPPLRARFEGYAAGANVFLESLEVGAYLRRVRDGDPACLELPYSPLPVRAHPLHGQLLEQVRFCLHLGLVEPWSRRSEEEEREASDRRRRLIGLRRTLTGAHLLRTGEMIWPLSDLLGALSLGEPRPQDPAWIRATWTRGMELLRSANLASPLAERPQHADLAGFLAFVRATVDPEGGSEAGEPPAGP